MFISGCLVDEPQALFPFPGEEREDPDELLSIRFPHQGGNGLHKLIRSCREDLTVLLISSPRETLTTDPLENRLDRLTKEVEDLENVGLKIKAIYSSPA